MPRLIEQTLLTGDHEVEVLSEASDFLLICQANASLNGPHGCQYQLDVTTFVPIASFPMFVAERNLVLWNIVADAEALKADGVKEITLLGQNVNSYGRDLYGEPRFADLLLRSIAATGIERTVLLPLIPKISTTMSSRLLANLTI